jgi:hypothetical protein
MAHERAILLATAHEEVNEAACGATEEKLRSLATRWPLAIGDG